MRVTTGTATGVGVRLAATAAASGALFAFAQRPSIPWPLALLALAPVSAALLDRRSKPAWPAAALAGIVFVLSATLLTPPWSDALASPGEPLHAGRMLIVAGISVHYALAFALVSRTAGLGVLACIIGPASLWAAAELLRGTAGHASLWPSFSAALLPADAALSGAHAETPVASLLSVGGTSLVTFCAAAFASALAMVWLERTDVRARARAMLGAVAAILFGIGLSSISQWASPPRSAPPQPLRVALVQPAMAQPRPGDAEADEAAFRRLVTLTAGPEIAGAALIVWPDHSIPPEFGDERPKKDEIQQLARERGAAILAGGYAGRPGSAESGIDVREVAVLFPADGSAPRATTRQSPPSLTAAAMSLLSDENLPAFPEAGLFTVAGWKIAPLVSLAAGERGVVARRVAGGADLLISLAGDASSDDGDLTEQAFRAAWIRAAEARRPLVRVAARGVSALVGPDGLVSWTLPLGQPAVALLDVIPPASDSLFARGGQIGFTFAIVVLAFATAALPWWSSGQAPSRESP